MERTVIFLVGFWFWLFRKNVSARYLRAASSLHDARMYLHSDYSNRASTQSRGKLLPEHQQALDILYDHTLTTMQTANKFWSLIDCYRYAKDELRCL
jgi:hypothetical protein